MKISYLKREQTLIKKALRSPEVLHYLSGIHKFGDAFYFQCLLRRSLFSTLFIICTGDKKTSSNNLLKNVVIFNLTQSGFVSLIDSLLRRYKPLDHKQVMIDTTGYTTE